ncbi:MAG: hypothetical protein J6Y77_06020 [Paludibacteraceae bacterium]|nr:hypothetical protein [Paludibacteraceae bacterium]
MKDSKEYVEYIKKSVKTTFPKWKELFSGNEDANGRFGVIYVYNKIEIEFVQDRGGLELVLSKNNKEPINFSWEDIKQGILKEIPDQDHKWFCSTCTELIDFYINFLKDNMDKFVFEE